MPELPEMENYKVLLIEKIKDKKIDSVTVNREKSINVDVASFLNRVANKVVVKVERRAKHLLIHLNSGDVLLLHLMLGGWMYYGTTEDKPDRTIQIQLQFGTHFLYFIGLRLGYLHVHTLSSVDQELADLGPEPLNINFSLDAFLEIAKKKRGKLKTTLVDQHFMSGIGNCYSDEICWHAEILPTRDMNELSEQELIKMYNSMKQVLSRATQLGGYMNEPFFHGDAKTGGYDDHTYVYDREGESCKRCGTPITRDEVSSKKTYYCIGCQN